MILPARAVVQPELPLRQHASRYPDRPKAGETVEVAGRALVALLVTPRPGRRATLPPAPEIHLDASGLDLVLSPARSVDAAAELEGPLLRKLEALTGPLSPAAAAAPTGCARRPRRALPRRARCCAP
jgi:antitoxin (DNA-binding transcriptional repressor) of toxin-antitoxin stability system